MTPLAVLSLVLATNAALHRKCSEHAACVGKAATVILHGKCRRRKVEEQPSQQSTLHAALMHSPSVLGHKGLLICRLMAVAVLIIAILLDMGEPVYSPHAWPLYYTNWTFVGFGIYALVGLWRCLWPPVASAVCLGDDSGLHGAAPRTSSGSISGGGAGDGSGDSGNSDGCSSITTAISSCCSSSICSTTTVTATITTTTCGEWESSQSSCKAATALVSTRQSDEAPATQSPASAPRRKCGECASCQLARWHWGDVGFLVLFQTVCAASVFLTIFYWLCVFEWETMARSSPLKHGASAALMLADVMCSRLPIMWRHAHVVTLYGTSYMFVMWANWLANGTWVYPVLDWTQPRSMIFYAMLPTLLLVCYWIMWRLSLLRDGMLLVASGSTGSAAAAAQLRRRVRLAVGWRRARQRMLRSLSARGMPGLLALATGVMALMLAAQRGRSISVVV